MVAEGNGICPLNTMLYGTLYWEEHEELLVQLSILHLLGIRRSRYVLEEKRQGGYLNAWTCSVLSGTSRWA